MSSRESGDESHVADVLPIDRDLVESLSWGLGSRIVDDAGRPHLEVVDRTARRSLAAFAVTDYTYVVRFRTPVGRETFFGVAGADLGPMLEELLDRGEWVLRRGRLDGI